MWFDRLLEGLLDTLLMVGVSSLIALLVVALGIAPDLIAETLYAFVFPAMISASSSVELLHFIDQLAMHLTGFLGNGLYNIGGLILTLLLLLHKPGLKLWIFPGILAGFLLAFTFSFDDFIIAFFVAGSQTTLPIYVFSSIRRGVTPEINAIGTMVLAVSLLLLVTAQLVLRSGAKKGSD